MPGWDATNRARGAKRVTVTRLPPAYPHTSPYSDENIVAVSIEATWAKHGDIIVTLGKDHLVDVKAAPHELPDGSTYNWRTQHHISARVDYQHPTIRLNGGVLDITWRRLPQ